MDRFILDQIRRRHLLREAEGYLELQLFDRALEVLDRLPENDRQSFHALLIRAEILRHMEQHQSALEIFSKLVYGTASVGSGDFLEARRARAG